MKRKNFGSRAYSATIAGFSVLAANAVGAIAAAAQGNDPTPTSKAEKAGGANQKGDTTVAPMSGMNTGKMVEGGSSKGMAVMSGMTAQVPKLKEKRVTTVKGDENWDIRTGFGRNAEMAGMMIQMMTEGVPGMEKMKMGVMTMDYGPKNFTETPDEKTPVSGIGGAVESTPSSPAGAMAGMAMSSSGGTSVQNKAGDSTPFTVSISPNPPVRGDNALDITITDKAGKPAIGLKLSAIVEMTSMDMGATKPAVKEIGNGHYATTVNFSMNGPWRVALMEQNKPLTTLEFQAGGKRPYAQAGVATTTLAPPTLEPGKESKIAPPPRTDNQTSPPMPAMGDMPAATTKAATATHGAGNSLQITTKIGGGGATVGNNKLMLTILGADGKPVIGAKVTVSVEMTSMDMGTTKPTVKEVGQGVYATTANFSMSGPWKVTVRVNVPGQPTQERTVPVTVRK